jgi:lambda family phage portal protein
MLKKLFTFRTIGDYIDGFKRFRASLARKRGFDAAKLSRLFSDWVTASTTVDADVEAGLSILRARSRQLCANNDYGKRFMSMLSANVVGPAGIKLQARAKLNGTGAELDTVANDKIEAAWQKWCKKENCTVTGKLTFIDVQKLVVSAAARDGEFIVRLVRGYPKNPFRFALQVVEADYLDHTFNDPVRNIKMGVELDQWKRPTYYHLTKYHPGESYYFSVDNQRQRIPADEVLHDFIMDRAEQTRGYPWTTTALRRLHQLGHYEESELISARVGAAKMGFFTQTDGVSMPYDDKDAKGNLIEDVSPGKFQQLPAGFDFKAFDIDHPNAGFDAFVKSIIRGAAAGLNVSYSSLSNDLSQANYSSLRQGALDERDAWLIIQAWVISHFCQSVYEAWLPFAIASGELALPLAKADRWQTVTWQARRWPWIDPLKEATANEKAVGLGVRSRTAIISEQGDDIDDTFAQLAAENNKAAKLGIKITPAKAGGNQNANSQNQND